MRSFRAYQRFRRTYADVALEQMRRFADLLIAGALLISVSPLMLAVVLAIRWEGPGPILGRQRCIAPGGRRFEMLKFRTIVPDPERTMPIWARKPTRIGEFLRYTRIESLPQLINVLRGEMSLVGPRPALPIEVEQYDDWIRNRLKVKPGMTGLWQVSGRTETSFADYIRFDLFYIQNWSLALDAWILWRTLRAVRSGEGAS